jgi:predicted MFS family arabinose efflux permease
MRARRLLGLLEESDFRRLYFARAFSQLGDGLVPVALAFAVLDVDASPSALGFVLAARSVPLVAFLLVGGVWADRLERQRLMLATDLLRAGTQGALAALVLTGRAELWHFVALTFLYGCGAAFFLPASTGLIPQVVSPGRLQQANALLSLTASAFFVVGPAAAGVIIAVANPGIAIAVDSVTFLISAAFLARLQLPRALERVQLGFLRDLRDGWREFRSRTWLWVDGVYSALGNAFTLAPLWALGPFVAERDLEGASSWAAIATAFGLGSVAGGLFAIRLRPERPLRLAVSALTLLALPPALLAVPTATASIAIASFAAGLGLIFFNTIFETTVQQYVPPESLSRVASIDWVLSVGLQPLGFALAGPLAEAIGLSATLWAAAVWLVVSTAVVLAVPSVRNLPRKEGNCVDTA